VTMGRDPSKSPAESRSRSRSRSRSESRSRSRSRKKDKKSKRGKEKKKKKSKKKRRHSSSYSSSRSRSRSRSKSRSKSKSKADGEKKEERKKDDKCKSKSKSRSRSRSRRGRSRSPKDDTTNKEKDRAGGDRGGGDRGGDRDRDLRNRGDDRGDRGRRDGSRDRGGERGGRRDGSRDRGRGGDLRGREPPAYSGGARRGGGYDDYPRGRDSMRGGGLRGGIAGGGGGGWPAGRVADMSRGAGARGSGFGRAADIGRGSRGTMGPTGPGRPVPHPHAPRREELFVKDAEEENANLVFYGAELDGTAVPCWAAAAGRAVPDSADAPHWGAYPATVAGIGAEVMDFIAFMAPDADELKARYAAMLRLGEAAKGLWPECETECFGSTKHKSPLFSSDLDLRVKTAGRYENIPECQGITQMGGVIMNQSWQQYCDPRTTGRVPMITYKDKPSGLKCKVCVGNRLTVRGTSFFNSPMIPLSARFPVFKLLMMPLKCVFTQRGLEKSFAGGLGTFRVGMMLLNYLAMHAPAATLQPTNDMLGGIIVGFFRYYAGESPDQSPEAATWQTWPENFKFKGEFYVMGVQVDFGGCAMGEVAQVFKAAVNVLRTMPAGGNSRVSCLTRLIKDDIIADAREGVRAQAKDSGNALPEGTVLPSMFTPEKRSTYAAAPVETLPSNVFGGPMGMGPAGAAMAAMGVGLGGDGAGGGAGAGGDEWGAAGAGGGGYGDAAAGAGGGMDGMGGAGAGGPDYPSQCITLKNMFDPAQMQNSEQMWHEINEDVRDECSKHGQILHIQVDAQSQGFVYLKFDSAAAAASARQTLNMRWFAGRLITCDFTPVAVYDSQFRL
jgi:hypothetical protein